MTQVQQNPNFRADIRLTVVGAYQSPDFYGQHFSGIEQIAGIRGYLPDSHSLYAFLNDYIGFSIPEATPEELSRMQATADFEAMPCCPYYGCMKMFDDVFVIKLS